MDSKTLTCQDCGQSFEFTAEEQQFFAEKGFQDPKRCPNCRRQKKDSRRLVFTKVNCSECGVETEVPFKPDGRKPVLCRSCFEAKGGGKGRRNGGYSNGSDNDMDMAA